MFNCTRQDMANPTGSSQQLRQEREANTFAIELLAPRKLVRARLDLPADLEHMLSVAEDWEINREAAARRYIEFHDECVAMVFSFGERVRYVAKGDDFPCTTVWANDVMPRMVSPPADESGLTTLDEASPEEWLARPDDVALYAQTLHQANEFAMTLLLAEGAHGDEA